MITLVIDPMTFDRTTIEIRGEKYRHLFRARRLPAGARLRLVDGDGRARWGVIARVDSQTALLELAEAAPDNESEIDVSVFVVPPKPQRLATLVEKTTELGVSAIHLLSSARRARSVRASEVSRLKRIAISAVEQSHRSRLPRISGPMSWEEMRGLTAELDTLWALDPTSGRRADSATGLRRGLVVGPEGGFDSRELADLSGIGCTSICLGERILRTETAAIVGSALLMI